MKPVPLQQLVAGQPILVSGTHFVQVTEELAREFKAGDALFAVHDTGELLHVPRLELEIASRAVDVATRAFGSLKACTDAQISEFFEAFACRLELDEVWAEILSVNHADVEQARARGRSTTRLEATDALRRAMIEGLRAWIRAPSPRGRVLERIQHSGWCAELIGAELGVVGFVFEGRPNVVADASGVLRSGNTVVFRIGRDALATAKSILAHALEPALSAAGLPSGAVSLVDSTTHAAGWALFSDPRLALAVARGSGPAVAALGGLAQRAGIPVSLHGTGGAWLFGSMHSDEASFEQAVFDSLDRKVCNTLNTCCVPKERAQQLVPALLSGLERAAQRRHTSFKLHVVGGGEHELPSELMQREVTIDRAAGAIKERQVELLSDEQLGHEWEWENSPEVTLKLTNDLEHAVELFNTYSPQFVACLNSRDAAEHEWFYARVNAPFVGDGFTRWVDGQFALRKPELGLSNWQHGRLMGRGGVLSGDGVFTVRTRVRRVDQP